MNTGPDYVAKPDSVGPPVPVADVAVVPEDYDGAEPDPDRPQGPDVTGELWIKGPQVVRGYWNRPEDTAKVFTRGWLHTGDVARLDDENFIYIVDRAKDVIIRGGENIYSVEIEDALYEHPAVAEVAAIGVPHPILGEEVGAVIVLRPGPRWRPTSSPTRGRPARRLQRADAPVVPRQPAAAQPGRQGAQALAAQRAARGHRAGGRGRLNPVQPAAAVNSSNWASESSTVAAPALSSRCSTLEVPGIGSSTGDRRSNQARAT